VLLDFGIAVERVGQLQRTLEAGVVGTPAYMSPEQAEEAAVDEATDWYSFGVMVHEALTGSLPFDGTCLQVIPQKQPLVPLPPSQVVSGVPADLERSSRPWKACSWCAASRT
jgi:serine/threonine protein kinase